MGESFRGSDQGVGSMVGGGGGEGEDGVDVWVKEGVNDGGSSRLEGSMTTMNVALVVAPGRRCRNNSKWYYWMAQRWREQTEGQEAQRRWSVHGRTGRGRGRGRERERERAGRGGQEREREKGRRRVLERRWRWAPVPPCAVVVTWDHRPSHRLHSFIYST